MPIGLIGIVLVTRYIENIRAEAPERLRRRRHGAVRHRGRGPDVRAVGRGLRDRAVAGRGRDPRHRRWSRWRLYLAYARRAPAPILDFSLLKLPTFRASLVGGFMFRIGVGAMPFLLPLLLQVGFDLTPFQSGLITFTSTMGALFMKARGAADAQALRLSQRADLRTPSWAGFRSRPARSSRTSTPFWIMIAMLMLGGFFRSLQFTSINALAYAEVPAARMSRATALAAVGQQVSLATGVAVGALTVEIVVRMNGPGRPSWRRISRRASCWSD